MELRDVWNDQAGVMSAETALMVALLAMASFATWRHLAIAIESHAEATSDILASG